MMSDLIAQRSKQFGLAEKLAHNPRLMHPSCSVRLDNMNNTNATTTSTASHRSRSDNSLFKVPGLPMRNHTQQRFNSQLNSTFSHSSVKCFLDNCRKSFLNNFESYLVIFENNSIQNEEQALLMYTELIKSTTSSVQNLQASMIYNSENNDESRPDFLLSKILKAMQHAMKQNETCAPCTSSQQPDLESQLDPTDFEDLNFHSTQIGNTPHALKQNASCAPSARSQQPDLESQLDPTDFDDWNFHSTRIENHFEEPNNKAEKVVAGNRSSSHSTDSKLMAFNQYHKNKQNNASQQNKNRFGLEKYNNLFIKNYSSISTDQLLGNSNRTAQSSARLMETAYNKERHSPDLSQLQIRRTKSDDNDTSMINAARIKNTLSRKLDSTNSYQCTPITQWTIKKNNKNSKIELIGCDTRSQNSKPASHGTVLSKKGSNLIKTNKGLFKLVGTMKQSNTLPSLVRKQFKTDFPRTWKKTLNESGLLD